MGAARFANSSWRAKLKDRQGQADVCKQVLGDIIIYTPVYYFPMFYVLKTVLQSKDGCELAHLLPTALSRYRPNIITDNLANFLIFTPITIVSMIVPMHWRLPLMIGGNYIFALILSYLRGREGSAIT